MAKIDAVLLGFIKWVAKVILGEEWWEND